MPAGAHQASKLEFTASQANILGVILIVLPTKRRDRGLLLFNALYKHSSYQPASWEI